MIITAEDHHGAVRADPVQIIPGRLLFVGEKAFIKPIAPDTVPLLSSPFIHAVEESVEIGAFKERDHMKMKACMEKMGMRIDKPGRYMKVAHILHLAIPVHVGLIIIAPANVNDLSPCSYQGIKILQIRVDKGKRGKYRVIHEIPGRKS
jgi:hypothetical protein